MTMGFPEMINDGNLMVIWKNLYTQDLRLIAVLDWASLKGDCSLVKFIKNICIAHTHNLRLIYGFKSSKAIKCVTQL